MSLNDVRFVTLTNVIEGSAGLVSRKVAAFQYWIPAFVGMTVATGDAMAVEIGRG